MSVERAEYERIAIPIDLEALSLEAPAFAHAVTLRAAAGAPIFLVTVVGPGPHPSGLAGADQETALRSLADQARARFGVPFQSEVLREADPGSHLQ
jgi:Universal stress protein family.